MKGYARAAETEDETVGTLAPWEALAVDAVGQVIDFWKFKRNHGRVWALLYLRDVALSAPEIQEALGLSKGGVSMLVRELEGWGVVRRQRAPSAEVWRYAAETDLMRMIGRVIEEREGALVSSVRGDLERAETLAKRAGASSAELERVRRMKMLALLVEGALTAFRTTARLDVAGAVSVLVDRARRAKGALRTP